MVDTKEHTNLLKRIKDYLDSGDSKITKESLCVWATYILSLIVGLVSAWASFAFCAHKQQIHNAALEAYEAHLVSEPPSTLFFIITMIFCWIACLVISLVCVALVQIIAGAFLTSNLPNRAEVRVQGVSISLLSYVALIAILIIF